MPRDTNHHGYKRTVNSYSCMLLVEAIERARYAIENESWDDLVKIIRINKLLDCIIEELRDAEEK